MESVTIGLDIGSSAVRAAEIQVTKDGRRRLRRYGQVGLPAGHVVDGEINNVPGVAAALKRLWAEAQFSTTDVIVGISGPRVFIRQADVPALSAEDLRSSLKFDAQEMVPIPMDDASFDFSLLDQSADTKPGGEPSRRILLVAAHRDLLRSYTDTLTEAGLTASVMDAAPLALLRCVPPATGADSTGVEVTVSIGAELTTVAVTEGGVPHFIRSLTLGGAKLTERIANTMHIELAVAERLKRGAVPADTPQVVHARKAMSPEMKELAEEVRATMDFFLAQSSGAGIDRVLVTGGASQTEGLAARIAGNLPTVVATLDPLASLDTSALGYDDQTMVRVAAGSATAIGLALWPTAAPLIRLNLLPDEVAAARRTRRLVVLAGVGVAAFAGLLAAVGAGQVLAVHSANDQAHAEQARVATLTGEVSRLQARTAVHAEMLSRAGLLASALKGDVDWVRVLGQLASVMPPEVAITSFNGSRMTNTSGHSGSNGSTGTVGTLTFAVKGTGGLPATAAWVQALQTDPDLSNVWATAISVKGNGGPVTFSSTADLTPVSYSDRAGRAHG